MGARSLRMKQEKLLSSVSSPPMPTSNNIVAYPPIFLSPSISFDPFSPSPSPLPAAAAVQNHSVPTAAIVGGGIAGVVVLAATATIISAVAGKVGLSCFLGPICKLLSCFTGKFLEPCTGRLNSLCNTLNKWNPASKRRTSGDQEARADHMDLYSALGGSPTRGSNAESAAAAAHSLAQSPLRDVVKGHTDHLEISAHAFLATNVSDFAESQLKKQTEIMLQPLNQNIAKAQGYAESLLSVTDNVSDDLRSWKQSADAQLSKLKANTNLVKTSMETISAEWKQPGNAALTILFEEGVEVKGGKAKNTIAKENAEGKLGITSNREADEFEEAELKQQVCIVESASDAFTELQIVEMGAPSSQKHETGGFVSGSNNMALVPTQYAGGNATSSQAAGTMVTLPTKAMAPVAAGGAMTSASKAEWAQDNNDSVMTAGKGKRKRPSNLGHVSFSCEMSAHRLRFFTACRSGGTYGSPPASPPDHNNTHNHNNNSLNYNNYHDHSLIKASDNYYRNSHPTNYHAAPLYNANLMHQQYHPSQSIVVHRDAQSPTLVHHTPLEVVIHNKSPSKPSIRDYGSPFDGVL